MKTVQDHERRSGLEVGQGEERGRITLKRCYSDINGAWGEEGRGRSGLGVLRQVRRRRTRQATEEVRRRRGGGDGFHLSLVYPWCR